MEYWLVYLPSATSQLKSLHYYGNYYGGLGSFRGLGYGYGSVCCLGVSGGCGCDYFGPSFYSRYWSSGFY
uniref:Uncharacterized protein n=1 Tax=Castor canadensis TaxID=51338 RepID=A0A8C0WMV5_CASCN